MRQALRWAEKGHCAVSPNPKVGACVVARGELVGKGFHAFYGGPHAETVAIRSAGKRAKGASLYVTLEPCSTWGKTPPCTDAILRAKIREVIIGSEDPNPLHRGKGVRILRKAGIRVRVGTLRREVERQNEAFFKWVTRRLPFVTLKMAQSLDGKIATCQGRSRWISGKASRVFVHQLRLESDAILVGKNTFLKDNPRLSPRLSHPLKPVDKPWRIVLDPRGEGRPGSRVFQGEQATFTVVSERFAKKILRKKDPSGRIWLPVAEKNGQLDLKDLLSQLAPMGVGRLLAEGGGEVAWSLLRQKLVDRIVWIIAPTVLGGRNAKTSVEGEGIQDLRKAFRCREWTVNRLGEDLVYEGRF